MVSFAGLSLQKWPKDPSEKDDFYGHPGIGHADPAWKTANLVDFTIPWKITSGNQSDKIHRLVKPSLYRVLNAIWDYMGHDQSKAAQYGLDQFSGSYAYRANRNNPANLSNHSYGIAIDLASDRNPNGTAWRDDGRMLPRFVIEAFKQEGWRWGGDFSGTKDAMHFEAVWDQHHDQQPVPAPTGPPTPAPLPPPSPASSPPPSPLPIPLPSDGGLTPLLELGEEAAALFVRRWISNKQIEADAFRRLRELAAVTRDASTVIHDAAAEFVKFADMTLGDQPAPRPGPGPTPGPGPVPQPGPGPEPEPPPAPPPGIEKQTDITATSFGGSLDPNRSAYDNHLITDTEVSCSLPGVYHGFVAVEFVEGGVKGRIVSPVQVVDKGPWNIRDQYWETGTRPLAESQHANRTKAQNGRVPSNSAGIDLCPGTIIAGGGAQRVGPQTKNWSGKVNWWPLDDSKRMKTPAPVPATTDSTTRGVRPMSMQDVFSGSKKWYQSSAMWGAIIAVASPLVGGLLHINIGADEASQMANNLANLGNIVVAAGPIVGGILAGVGRVKANSTITFGKQAPAPPQQ